MRFYPDQPPALATLINDMKAPTESVRLSEIEKELLTRIKRKTSIESWNVICRWALAAGLASNQTNLTKSHEKLGAVDIRWETFAGRWSDFICASVFAAHRSYILQNPNVTVAEFFQMALARGIRILAKQTSATGLGAFSIMVKSETKNQPAE